MSDLNALIESESDLFLDAVLRAEPGAPVTTCPGWTADDLLWHLTEVHGYWARVLATGALTDEEGEAAEQSGPPRPSDRESLASLYRRHTADLLAELRRHADDEPAYFWLDAARHVGAIRRMQAHEAAMHRVDAELCAGLTPTPHDAALAVDGVAHAVEVMWAWWGTLPGFRFSSASDPVELVATDAGQRWLLQPGRWTGVGQSGKAYDEPGVVLTTREQVSARVVGDVEELYRWLWGRGPEPATSGEESTLAALRAARDQGMQ